MLERLTVDDFSPLVGDRFVVADGSAGLHLELASARTWVVDAGAVDSDGRRTPFTLTFSGPGEPMLEQRIHRLEHDGLGTLEVFLVPVGRDAGGASYEAVFA